MAIILRAPQEMGRGARFVGKMDRPVTLSEMAALDLEGFLKRHSPAHWEKVLRYVERGTCTEKEAIVNTVIFPRCTPNVLHDAESVLRSLGYGS